MTGGKNSGGPKERDNGDRSLRGLMVALAIIGAIAGSVILIAYAFSDSQTPPDKTARTVGKVASPPEEKPEITEEVTDESVPVERIESINSTAETEEDELPVYPEKEAKEDPSNVNTTTGVEKQVPYTEQEQPAYTNASFSNLTEDDGSNFEESSDDTQSYQNTGDESQALTPTEPDEQENEGQDVDDAKDVDQDSSDETDEPELQDVLPKRVLDLLNKVIAVDDDDGDDNKNKGKDHKGYN